MSLIPVLPLFLELNRQYFQNSLFENGVPRVSVRWSDGRMRTTAELHRSKTNLLGVRSSEIILSSPVLVKLPQKALFSAFCYEMIHAYRSCLESGRSTWAYCFNVRQRSNPLNLILK